MNNSKSNKTVIVKPYGKKELTHQYGVSICILNSWLKSFESELGNRVAGVYNIRQVKLIFEKLGVPGQVIEINN
jgi:hypothetical protein